MTKRKHVAVAAGTAEAGADDDGGSLATAPSEHDAGRNQIEAAAAVIKKRPPGRPRNTRKGIFRGVPNRGGRGTVLEEGQQSDAAAAAGQRAVRRPKPFGHQQDTAVLWSMLVR
jgi:hypothetical protein